GGKKARAALRKHPDYGDFSQRIETAWERASAAADQVHAEQERAAEILRENLPPPPECPRATRNGTAKPALFDSGSDFVTATRRLIADKKLIGPGANEDDDDDGGGQ